MMDKKDRLGATLLSEAINKAIVSAAEGASLSTVALLHATVYHACLAARMGRVTREEFMAFVGNGFDCAEEFHHD